jgi:raffinose/stachyose/melibiose transport system permease protein
MKTQWPVERPARPCRAARVGSGAVWRGSRAQKLRAAALPYLFILPTMALLALFMYLPAATALERSLYAWDGISAPTFIGIDNFTAMASDPVLQQAFTNVLRLTVFAMTVQVAVPLMVARVILSLRSTRAQYLIRVLFIIPLVVPQVVIALIWGFLYDADYGVINQVLTFLHLDTLTQAWLGDPNLAIYSIMFIGFPFVDGFGLLIFTAGLQSISAEVLQAAAVDGAGPLSRFLRIELPLVVGQIRLLMVLNMIWSIQSFVTILVLTQGAPGYATYVPGLALFFNAFQYQRMGYACAIGAALFVVMLVVTVLNLTYLRARTDYNPARTGA